MAARAKGIAFAVALAALCTACSAVSDPAAFAVVTQDKFDFLTCPEIAAQRGNLVNREKELAELTARAESSPGGFIVSYSAYRSELTLVRGQVAAANRALQKNGCGPPK